MTNIVSQQIDSTPLRQSGMVIPDAGCRFRSLCTSLPKTVRKQSGRITVNVI